MEPPILTGAVFHELRHHHKTVLDELDVPEVLEHERMGNGMRGIQGVYSQVTDAMRRRLVTTHGQVVRDEGGGSVLPVYSRFRVQPY